MSKPRLRLVGHDYWQCSDGFWLGFGSTPAKAYDAWSVCAMPGIDNYAKAFNSIFSKEPRYWIPYFVGDKKLELPKPYIPRFADKT